MFVMQADIDHAALTYRCLAHGFLSSLRKNEVQRSPEATDVNAATESPTKSARESLFAYLMTQLHLLRRFHAGTNMPILSSPIPDRPLGFHTG